MKKENNFQHIIKNIKKCGKWAVFIFHISWLLFLLGCIRKWIWILAYFNIFVAPFFSNVGDVVCMSASKKNFFLSVIFSLYDFTLGTAIGSSCFVGFPMKTLLRYILLKVWKLKCAAKRTKKNELSLKSLQKKNHFSDVIMSNVIGHHQ